MAQWYHSGIEGYCKAAAVLAGMEGSGGWSVFGSDLFPRRFVRADKATKTWTLSRYRRGSGNRLAVFEDEWVADGDGRASVSEREGLAVDACVEAMIESAEGGTNQDSPLASLMLIRENYRFANGFSSSVLPAIANGFQSEGYHSADVTRFLRSADALIGELRPGDKEAFRAFARILVAALVYGPNHALVVSEEARITAWRVKPLEAIWNSASDGGTIEISQAFSFDRSYIGYSECFDDESAVFFGRSAVIDDYLNALDCLQGDLAERLRADVMRRERIIFPISHAHRLVSDAHGLLLHRRSRWLYFDFSSHGTSIANGLHGDVRFVRNGWAVVNAGDRICLGSIQVEGDRVMQFQKAATVIVSFRVEE